jgi:hypothetical protein
MWRRRPPHASFPTPSSLARAAGRRDMALCEGIFRATREDKICSVVDFRRPPRMKVRWSMQFRLLAIGRLRHRWRRKGDAVKVGWRRGWSHGGESGMSSSLFQFSPCWFFVIANSPSRWLEGHVSWQVSPSCATLMNTRQLLELVTVENTRNVFSDHKTVFLMYDDQFQPRRQICELFMYYYLSSSI